MESWKRGVLRGSYVFYYFRIPGIRARSFVLQLLHSSVQQSFFFLVSGLMSLNIRVQGDGSGLRSRPTRLFARTR